jgi:hypothetical protein
MILRPSREENGRISVLAYCLTDEGMERALKSKEKKK